MQLPDNIDIDHPEKYTLSVRITPDVFALCIYEPHSGDNYYKEIPFSSESGDLNGVQQIVFDSEFLTLPFGRVNVVFVSKDYDLVPHYMIQKDKKEALYNFTHYLPAKQILYCPEAIQQISTVFNVDVEVYKFLARNLNNPEFYHHSHLLMQYLETRNRALANISKMYLNFHGEFVDLFCYNQSSQILHAITLQNENEHNLVYHILNVWDKCDFDQSTDILFLLSSPSGVNLYISSVLSEYIKHIERVNIMNEINVVNPAGMHESLPLDLLIPFA